MNQSKDPIVEVSFLLTLRLLFVKLTQLNSNLLKILLMRLLSVVKNCFFCFPFPHPKCCGRFQMRHHHGAPSEHGGHPPHRGRGVHAPQHHQALRQGPQPRLLLQLNAHTHAHAHTHTDRPRPACSSMTPSVLVKVIHPAIKVHLFTY